MFLQHFKNKICYLIKKKFKNQKQIRIIRKDLKLFQISVSYTKIIFEINRIQNPKVIFTLPK